MKVSAKTISGFLKLSSDLSDSLFPINERTTPDIVPLPLGAVRFFSWENRIPIPAHFPRFAIRFDGFVPLQLTVETASGCGVSSVLWNFTLTILLTPCSCIVTP